MTSAKLRCSTFSPRIEKQSGHANHAVHRCADFVAHAREKVAFSVVGYHGPLLRFLELLLEKLACCDFGITQRETIAQFHASKTVPAG